MDKLLAPPFEDGEARAISRSPWPAAPAALPYGLGLTSSDGLLELERLRFGDHGSTR